MEIIIPKYFQNYTERKTWRGIERTSTTIYKGHKIYLNSYATDGIMCIISKRGFFYDKIIAKERHSYIDPVTLLRWAKDLIDFRKNKVKISCWWFHREFLDEQYSSIGRPIKICKKCKK